MRKYAAYLHSIWLSQRELWRIFEDNDDFKWFFENLDSSKLKAFSISQKRTDEIMVNYLAFDSAKIDKVLSNLKVIIILESDSDYPENLKYIPNPPFIIYVRWNLDNSIELISIVGSRKCTSYSETVLKPIIPWLIKAGFW
jgi:predicted Rossmann fold nucleotide-binding protein DprA/Smf involved in DNA uptake